MDENRSLPPHKASQHVSNALPDHILVVDDDEDTLELLQISLEKYDFRVTLAKDGAEAMKIVHKDPPDLILLDLMMPDVDGLQVCRMVKANTQMPIIVISAIGLEEKKVEALDLGADDYLTKPFGVKELMARIRAVIRRSRQFATPRETLVHIGQVFADLESGSLIIGGERVNLTPTEYKLMAEMLRSPGEVLPHKRLLQEVWGRSYTDSVEYLHMYISRLRTKLDAFPDLMIQTHTGRGYSLHIQND
jgi:DNA-binding response OmpR family regulator